MNLIISLMNSKENKIIIIIKILRILIIKIQLILGITINMSQRMKTLLKQASF
jgi:hypothetical protein